MKVITTFSSAKHSGIFSALENTFQDFERFSYKTKPAFDLFDTYTPDIVFCDIDYITDNFIRACNESDAKIILFGNMVPNEMNVDLVCPDVLISNIMKKNLESSYDVYYTMKYANIDKYKDEQKTEKISYDITYISNIKNYANHLNTFLKLDHLFSLGICGKEKMPILSFLGSIEECNEMSFLRTGKVSIDLNGETILDQAANKIFTISNLPNTLFPHFNESNYYEVFKKYLNDEDERKRITEEAYQKIMNGGTNYHMLQDILDRVKITSNINNIMETKLCNVG